MIVEVQERGASISWTFGEGLIQLQHMVKSVREAGMCKKRREWGEEHMFYKSPFSRINPFLPELIQVLAKDMNPSKRAYLYLPVRLYWQPVSACVLVGTKHT